MNIFPVVIHSLYIQQQLKKTLSNWKVFKSPTTSRQIFGIFQARRPQEVPPCLARVQQVPQAQEEVPREATANAVPPAALSHRPTFLPLASARCSSDTFPLKPAKRKYTHFLEQLEALGGMPRPLALRLIGPWPYMCSARRIARRSPWPHAAAHG